MTGGVLITAFLIPTISICVNRGKSKVLPLDSEVTLGEEEEEKFNKVSKEVQTDQIEDFGKRLRAGTFSRKRSSSAII